MVWKTGFRRRATASSRRPSSPEARSPPSAFRASKRTARILVTARFCGLAVLTMAVTYLIEVQEDIARRDTGVIKITTASGQPPSALLERYADLDVPEEMRRALYDGRDWCALVLQSHASNALH